MLSFFSCVFCPSVCLIWKNVCSCFLNFFFNKESFFNVYLFLREKEREREIMNVEEAEREGDTESEAGSRFQAASTNLDMGLKLMNCDMTWAEVESLTDWATQVPPFCPFSNWIICFFGVLSFISSLYILVTNLLSDMSLAIIFSYSIFSLLIQ